MGSYITTWTGNIFDFENITENDIYITDIAWSLSNICRFNGHCKWPYTVAQHSLNVMSVLPYAYKMFGLLHDASEAYIGDVCRPLKRLPEMEEYKNIEDKIFSKIISELLGVNKMNKKAAYAVKEADSRMVMTEARFVLNPKGYEYFMSQESSLLPKPYSNEEIKRYGLVFNTRNSEYVYEDFMANYCALLEP